MNHLGLKKYYNQHLFFMLFDQVDLVFDDFVSLKDKDSLEKDKNGPFDNLLENVEKKAKKSATKFETDIKKKAEK